MLNKYENLRYGLFKRRKRSMNRVSVFTCQAIHDSKA